MSNLHRDTLTSDCFYHIYNRSADRESMFREDSDYQFFLKKYQTYFERYFDTYAYCLMPNHFHLIIKVKDENMVRDDIESEFTKASDAFITGSSTFNLFLADQMRRLFSSVSIKLNNKYKRKGPLFARSYKKVWIENEDRLRYLIAYVHHNPIHHHFEKSLSKWTYSSFNDIKVEGAKKQNRLKVLELFDGRDGFDSFHDSFVEERKDPIDV